MNELHTKFASEGLSVVGVTGETQAQTDPWIEKHGAKYAYGYDKGMKLMSKVGAGGYPSAALIDENGVLVWQGNPGALTDDIIRGVLPAALDLPVWEWPESAAKARKMFVKGDIAKALEEAAKLGEDGAAVHTALQGVVTGKVAGLETLMKGGDWLAVEDRLELLDDALDGLPEHDQVEAAADILKKDKVAQEILDAQKKVRKMLSGKIKKGQIPGIQKKLEKIASDLPRTAAARDAENGIRALRSKVR